MANQEVRSDTQFSVFLVNKPGILARVCHHLAESKINILALSMMDSTEHGVLRLVATDASKCREALGSLDLPTTETPVMLATMPNRPGALADVVERLSIGRINVNYAYCTTGSANGKTIGIFRVSDMKKAQKVLSERKPVRKEATVLRTTGRGRARR